jgi:hypothetical protein
MPKVKRGPTLGNASTGARKAREERLAAALRENLHKRKAQARERAVSDAGSPKSNKS